MRRILSALFGILIVAWVAPALAQDSAADKLQSWESALTSIEQELVANPDLPSKRYGEILRTVHALVTEANALRTAERHQTAPSRAQLNQLGSPPAEGAPPEDPDIAATRARLSDEIGKSQARVKRAELVITRVQAIESDIGRREQETTQRKLAVQGPMPWSIATWQAALSEDDVIYKKIQPSAVQWWRNLPIAKMGWVAIAIGAGI